MRRRGWRLFQVGCGVILLLAAPSTVGGLARDIRGPYEVHAAPGESGVREAVLAPEDRPASPRAEAGSVRTP